MLRVAKQVEISAADGYVLHGSLYEGVDDVLLVASAMGVKRRYYDAFAQYVSERGRSVLTFDYRGIGDSRPKSLRGFMGTMRDWGTLDIAAAIDWISRELRPRSFAYLGHSCGGQLLGFAPNADRVDRAVFTCAQSGYWRHWPGVHAYALGSLWVAMPVISNVVGLFPSKILGLGSEDLPRTVASEWAKWGRHRDYLFGYNDSAPYARLSPRILAWSFADDRYAPKPAVEALLSYYKGAAITHRHVESRDIGHFGFFRRGKGEAMWDETVEWLE
jgi:predicted alpha/beta hydrolase